MEEYGTVEFAPKQEGRNIIMTLAPKGKKVHTQSEQRRRGDQSRAERQARQAARLAAKQEAQAQAAAEAKAAVASERVRVTGSGKLMHAGSAMRHNLEHKSARKRRALKADGVLATSQSKNMKKLLGR